MTAAVIWTVIAGIGLIASVVLIVEALRDRRAVVRLNGDTDSVRALVARTSVRNESLRVVTQGLFLMVGLVSIDYMATDSPPPTWFGTVLAWSLVAGSAAVTTNSVLNLYARRKIDRLLREERR